MKKIVICGITAALCALALSTQAFATDITEDTSIFAGNPEELLATIKGWPEPNTFLDPKTIMPIYQADINDFINTGKLVISEVDSNGYRYYISDLVDSNGAFLGVVRSVGMDGNDPEATQFCPGYDEDPLTYEKNKQCSSVDFRLYSKEIKSLMLDKGISTDVKEVKLLYLDGIGTVYYINNGTDEVIAKMRGLESISNYDYFEKDDASDIIVLNEEFRQKAAHAVEEERKAYEDFKDKYGDEAYGAGGNGANPNTGSDTSKHTAALAVELGLMSAMIIGGVVVGKKRKNER